jgi:DNA-directed RNA polymerase specialized sigma24 family protein
MRSSQDQSDLNSFVDTYQELMKQYANDECARAFLNSVAIELLDAMRRKKKPVPLCDAKRYFLWLLRVKRFFDPGHTRRDVDLPRRRLAYRDVVHVSLDDLDCSGEMNFVDNPHFVLEDDILFEQVLAPLHEDEYHLLCKRVVEGNTLAEIALTSNITPQGVKKRLDKIYSKIRQQLALAGV